ncbi:WD repeat-containing protein 19 [Dermatophagoides pteronyssinus]|uniref:WD repeat-containing protein 19 n=1 Tax=Dermatophagoides pteronyssinus TaxID=6956 RepID=A0ABQ8JQI0_DERPT|nr:WD repeat-containing protein 19 [Dermatophagoides pteronyssinus]
MKRIYSIPCTSMTSNINDQCLFKWQTKKSKYLAISTDNIINIYNRHGEHVDQINLFGLCTALCWDEDGDWLAIITNRSSLIFLWNSITNKLEQIDSGMKETLTTISWSKLNHSNLLLGTNKGNILIYNNQTARKNPIYGKHNKRIISCCWNSIGTANMFAIVGEDHILTVNNEDGDTLIHNTLKGDGSNVKFFYSYQDTTITTSPASSTLTKSNNNNNIENGVCLVLNKRMLYMLNIQDSENSFILNFKDWYENIIDYYCYPSGNIFIAFTSGLIITISTGMKNFGVELLQIKAHRESMTTFNVCMNNNRIATCDENNIKIFDLYEHNDIESVFTVDDEPSIVQIDWTADGQLLALCSNSGNIHVYLSQLKIIGDNCGTSLAFLSSLLEVTVFNVHEEIQDSVMIVRIEIEPSRLAIGPFHLAIAMNNKVWLYILTEIEMPPQECEYTGIIKDIKLNQFYMVILFTNGSLQFHPIEQRQQNINVQSNNNNNKQQYFLYPDSQKQEQIGMNNKKISVTSLCLTNEFLIFATDNGTIIYFIIEDWDMTVVYRHRESIQMIQCNQNGTRLVLIDSRNEAYVYNVYGETLISIPTDHVPSRPLKILWESWMHDHCVFTICDNKFIHVYSSPLTTIHGSIVDFVGRMKIPSGQYPLLLYNGVVVCQTKSGKTSNFVLSTHDYAIKNNSNTTIPSTFKRDVFRNILKLRRYQDAIKICNFLGSDESEDLWIAVGRAAIQDLDLNVAICVYQKLYKFTIVYCLERYRNQEEHSLLCGLLAEMLANYDLAQKHFLNSSQPIRALEMRKNLQHWNEALALARHLLPNDIPIISRELAFVQELRQEYSKSLENFEAALNNQSSDEANNNEKMKNESKELIDNSEHKQLCLAGIARNSIRCGNLKKALTIANQLNDAKLIQECASILESFNHIQEAATLYERCQQYNQAATLYLKVKNSAKLSGLISKISDREILGQYGRIKEMEKQFRHAAEIYGKAERWEDVVRINLDHLNNPGEAVKIVREHQSIAGAKLVARFFQRLNDMTAAIEFLIMSKCYDDAYNLALTTGQMDIYADIMQYHAADIDDDNDDNDSNVVDGKNVETNDPMSNDNKNGEKVTNLMNNGNGKTNLQHFRTIAIYYEQENNLFKAGKFYCIARMWRKGVKLLLESTTKMQQNSINNNRQLMNNNNNNNNNNTIELNGDSNSHHQKMENEALTMAIDVAARVHDEQITRLILDYLMGETDGIPKDFKYLFRLYMKLKYYAEAAKTATIIAREEQMSGNYRNAHQLFFSMCIELRKNHIAIPSEMVFNLMLIHSYMLAKLWIRIGDHQISAKLLIRVYDNINQFPSHSVQILTSVVVECIRAGYMRNALKYAFILMKQENLNQIDSKLKKKIENLVRKSASSEKRISSHEELRQELAIESNPCPYCSESVLDDEFVCNGCRTAIPFCIASGMHIRKSDLTKCFHCQFPAIKTYLLKLLKSSTTIKNTNNNNDYGNDDDDNNNNNYCPMCEQKIDKDQLKQITMDEIFNINILDDHDS